MKKILIINSLLLCALFTQAHNLPEPMKPARLVNDFTGTFSPREQAELERKLVAFDRETSTQIAVVTVNDLDGTSISDYAAQLFDKWGIGGSSKKNNGILILLKPKTPTSRGEVFISTGYGLEGAVPDALAGRIVDYDMIPSFRENNYYAGVDKAVNTLMSLTKGEFTAEQYIDKHESVPPGALIGLIIFGLIILGSIFGGGRRNNHTYTADGDIARSIIIGSILASGHRSHGGGGFGGFSGGSGGGFGGGFTGGGGAGGSW